MCSKHKPYKEKYMSFRIEVLENNTVEIFNDAQEAPVIRQPNWPNQTAWANASEARTWAEQWVESVEDENAPYAANGPGEERKAKPTPEEIAEWEAQRNPQA